MSAHREIFEKMAALLSGKQRMAILGRRKDDWEVIFKTGEGWDFNPGSLRQRVIKFAETDPKPTVVMDSHKDDRFVDSKPPFRSALCIPIVIPGKLPLMIFAEEPEKLQSFQFNTLPVWEELVAQLRVHLPDMKALQKAAEARKKAPSKPGAAPKMSLNDMISKAINPDGDPSQKVEVNWGAVAVVLLTILAAIGWMVRAFFQARDQDNFRLCGTNLNTIATAARMYAKDHQGAYPKSLETLTANKYLEEIPRCPAAGAMTYTDYETSNKPAAVTVSCTGGHHRHQFKGSGNPEKYPFFSSYQFEEEMRNRKKPK